MPTAETGSPSANSHPVSGRIGGAWLLQIGPLEAYGNVLNWRPTCKPPGRHRSIILYQRSPWNPLIKEQWKYRGLQGKLKIIIGLQNRLWFLFLLNEINCYKRTTVIPGTQLNAVAFQAGNMDWISRETTQMHGQGCLFQNEAQETPNHHSTPRSTEQEQ